MEVKRINSRASIDRECDICHRIVKRRLDTLLRHQRVCALRHKSSKGNQEASAFEEALDLSLSMIGNQNKREKLKIERVLEMEIPRNVMKEASSQTTSKENEWS
jgi:hypothetical protein